MAIDFDGTSGDNVKVASTSALQLTSALTITAWIKGDAFDTGANVDVVVRKGESNPNNYQFAIRSSKVALFLDTSDNTPTGAGATNVSTGILHHVVATWANDADDEVRIYLDGLLDNTPSSDTHTSDLGTDTRPLYIGGRDVTTGDLFDGSIEDVRIYDRELSAAEIQTIFAARGTDGIVAGLVGRWLMNEGAPGTVVSGAGSVKDMSNNGHDGTPTSTPEYAASELRFRRKVS